MLNKLSRVPISPHSPFLLSPNPDLLCQPSSTPVSSLSSSLRWEPPFTLRAQGCPVGFPRRAADVSGCCVIRSLAAAWGLIWGLGGSGWGQGTGGWGWACPASSHSGVPMWWAEVRPQCLFPHLNYGFSSFKKKSAEGSGRDNSERQSNKNDRLPEATSTVKCQNP